MKTLTCLFAPGDWVRFKRAPDIEGHVSTVTFKDDGGLVYCVCWFHEGQRQEACGLAEAELEGAT